MQRTTKRTFLLGLTLGAFGMGAIAKGVAAVPACNHWKRSKAKIEEEIFDLQKEMAKRDRENLDTFNHQLLISKLEWTKRDVNKNYKKYCQSRRAAR